MTPQITLHPQSRSEPDRPARTRVLAHERRQHQGRRAWLRRSAALTASAGLGLCLSLGMSGCASLGGPAVFTLGEAELQALVGRAFPQQRRVLELLDLELRLPSLRLLPEQNRLALVLSVDGRERLSTRALQGAISFDTALRWEPSDQSLRLTQVRVQRLSLGPAGSPGAAAASPRSTASGAQAAPGAETLSGLQGFQGAWAERIGQGVAARLLDDLVIYRLPPERRAELARLGVAPSAVTVTARGVEFTLSGARAAP